MCRHIRTRMALGVVAVAALWLVACGGPSDESVIQSLEDGQKELRTQLDDVKNAVRDLDDQLQQVKDDLTKTKSFIPKPGTPSDLPGQINALTVKVDSLEKALGQGGAAPKAAETAKTKAAAAAPAAESAGPGAAVPAEPPGGAAKKAPAGAAKKAKAATAAPAAAGEAKAAPASGAAAPTAAAPGPRASGVAPGGEYYTVKSGDTLESIAKAKGVSAQQLRADNNLSGEKQPEAGTRIWISGGKR